MDSKQIIQKVQTKKYKNIEESIICEKINEFLKRNPKVKLASLTEKSAEFKKIVKYVKQELHKIYGAFQTDIAKREKLLERLKKTNPKSKEFLELHKKILLTHKSTKERMNFYNKIYKDLFLITMKPEIILDLGCGLNPFSLPFMEFDGLYIAVEFNKKDIDFINEYFSFIKKIKKGIFDTLLLDVRKDYVKLKNIPTDIVFAWKLFDVVDTKTTENIIKNLNTKYLIASFSTITLGEKKMIFPRRSGFQKMLRRLNLSYTTKQYENELFYIIKWQLK